MKRIKKHCRYGYKIGYTENGIFVRHFIVKTYRDAVLLLPDFIRYTTHAREDNHRLNNPVWQIIPILHSEFARGIWRECPF
ncbi:MAG: hypothetical protein RR405_04070 [Clostridia bacterium]